jgi:hypothetical protein
MGPPEGFPVKSSASKTPGFGFKVQGSFLQNGLQPSSMVLVYVIVS